MTICYNSEEKKSQYINDVDIDYLELRSKHLIIQLKNKKTIAVNMKYVRYFDFDDRCNTNIGGYDM